MPDRSLGDIEGQLYGELRRIAGAIGGRAPDAPQRTSLVHEAKLARAQPRGLRGQGCAPFSGRRALALTLHRHVVKRAQALGHHDGARAAARALGDLATLFGLAPLAHY
jgi:hypothetical protein